jgi:hypothetical protein
MVRVVRVTPRPLFIPGEGTQLPVGQEAGWNPEPVWIQRPGIEHQNPGLLVCSPEVPTIS